MPNLSDVDENVLRAFELVAEDQIRGAFYVHPFDLQIHRKNFDWLTQISKQLTSGHYVPAQARPVDVPKPGFHIRPASHLTLHDQIALQFLLLHCKKALAPIVNWSEGTLRFSHIMSDSGGWFKSPFAGWKRFREASLEKAQTNCSHVLVTDIAGYYENIDIQRVITELKAVGIEHSIVDLLSRCLNKWAGPRHRGIPQGYSAAQLLGEFYLDSVDRHLKSAGFTHLRYLDDIRVFARTIDEARRALHRLTILLRDRGLNLQTAKSKILTAKEALNEIDGVDPLIRKVSDQLASELRELEAIGYVGLEESKRALENHQSPPVEVIKIGWKNFTSGNWGPFNKTLFHYLIKRLAAFQMTDGVNYALACLRERPEEAEDCLDYLSTVAIGDATVIQSVVDILVDPETTFEYQRYTILRWLYSHSIKHEQALEFCKTVPSWSAERFVVKPHAIAYFGKFAALHDYEVLESIYRNSSDWLERATVICALKGAPPEIRNTLYGRVQGENDLIDRAIKFAKSA